MSRKRHQKAAAVSAATARPSSERLWRRVALGMVLAVQAGWCARFILATSMIVGGRRVFLLFDDEMISMAYARNLAHGWGLNWARYGDPVEGFSNPLWTLWMAALHLLPLDPFTSSLWVQITGLALLVANTWLIARIVRTFLAPGSWMWLVAALGTAFTYSLSFWTLRGFETGVQALSVTAAVWFAMRIAWRRDERWWRLGAVLAAAVLTRLDMMLLVGGLVAWLAVELWRRGHLPDWRAVGLGVAAFAGPNLLYEAFRIAYFHDILPNTYYHKATGIAGSVVWLRGWGILREFLPSVALPLLAVAGVAAWRRSTRPLLLLALPMVYWAYNVSVGGDVWEGQGIGANRWLCFTLPLLMAGMAWAGGELLRARKGTAAAQAALVAALSAIVILLPNSLLGPGALRAWRQQLVLDAPYSTGENVKWFVRTMQLKSHLLPGARVGTVWAGIPAYFLETEMVDFLGLNDRHIARLKLDMSGGRYGDFRPGHNKWDYDYSLATHQPDAVFQVWGPKDEERGKLIEKYGYVVVDQVWYKKGSEKIRWE